MAALLDGAISATFRRRDVGKTFTLARATDNPFTTMVAKGERPKSTMLEFPFKTRHTPSDNAVDDGADVQDSELINNEANKTMLYARTQKGRVATGVDDVAEELGEEYAVSGGLLADNLADAIILARENMEFTSIKSGDSTTFVSGTSQRRTRGLVNWCRSANPGGSPDLPIAAAALTPAGNIVTGRATADDVTMADFLGILLSIVTTSRSMKNLHVFVTPAMRIRIAQWVQFVTAPSGTVPVQQYNVTRNSKDKEVVMSVERIVCDIGRFTLHTHFSLPSGVHVLVVDMDVVKQRPARSPKYSRLEYRGGYIKEIIEYIFATEVNNPQLLGKITT
jgi:hypothetical protein